MTENKPIIIDGCDVSGCEYYDKNKHLLTCICEEYPCSECSNCYFKQLARKTQECEELRTDIKDIANLLDLDTGEEYNFGNIEIAIKGLKQECEELKKQLIQKDEVNTFFNTPIEGWDNDPCKICESKQNYEQLKAKNEILKEKITISSNSDKRTLKIIKTLVEIKKIAEKLKNFYEELSKCDDLTVVRLKQILQKISEVE